MGAFLAAQPLPLPETPMRHLALSLLRGTTALGMAASLSACFPALFLLAVADVDTEPKKDAVIDVQVIDQQHLPVPAVAITVLPYFSPGATVTDHGSTDAAGRWSSVKVVADQYYVRITPPIEYYVPRTQEHPVYVVIGRGERMTVIIRLQKD
jgi:hypothetical protein